MKAFYLSSPNIQITIYIYVYIIFMYIKYYEDCCHCFRGAQVVESLSPALAIYENVMSATHRTKDKNGELQKPCVEAGYNILCVVMV